MDSDSGSIHIDSTAKDLNDTESIPNVLLPEANITRLMKVALPLNTKISKSARICVMECASEFISFITSEASDLCKIDGRRTISSEDILKSLETLGFDQYIQPLKIYLKKYRETGLNKRSKSNLESEDDSEEQDSGNVENYSNTNISNEINLNDQIW